MYDPRDFYVPSDWKPVFSNSTHAGDFIGDPCVDAKVFIGWLTPENGFVSPDKAMDKHKWKVEVTTSVIRSDEHFLIMNQVLPRMAYIPSLNMMEYILKCRERDIAENNQGAINMVSDAEIETMNHVIEQYNNKD